MQLETTASQRPGGGFRIVPDRTGKETSIAKDLRNRVTINCARHQQCASCQLAAHGALSSFQYGHRRNSHLRRGDMAQGSHTSLLPGTTHLPDSRSSLIQLSARLSHACHSTNRSYTPLIPGPHRAILPPRFCPASLKDPSPLWTCSLPTHDLR